MSVTTSAGFTIPAIGGNVAVTVSDSSQSPQYSNVILSDGTNAALMQVDFITDSTHFQLITINVFAGSVGNTMASGANVISLTEFMDSLSVAGSPATQSDLFFAQTSGGVSYGNTLGNYGVPAAQAPTHSLHAVQAGISSIIHQWRCNDAAGSTLIKDSVGSTNMALTTTSSGTKVGLPGLANDLQSCIRLGYFTSGNYLKALSVVPTSGSYCVEMLVAVPMVVQANSYGILGIDGASLGNYAYYNGNPSSSSSYGIACGNGSANGVSGYTPGMRPWLLHLETDGTTLYFYMNAQLLSGSLSLNTSSPTGTLWVGCIQGTSYSGPLLVQNIAVYNARLSATQKKLNCESVVLR